MAPACPQFSWLTATKAWCQELAQLSPDSSPHSRQSHPLFLLFSRKVLERLLKVHESTNKVTPSPSAHIPARLRGGLDLNALVCVQHSHFSHPLNRESVAVLELPPPHAFPGACFLCASEVPLSSFKERSRKLQISWAHPATGSFYSERAAPRPGPPKGSGLNLTLRPGLLHQEHSPLC